MHPKRKNWPYLAVGIVAAAIPLSALVMEPPSEAEAFVDQQVPGVLQQTDNLDYVWILQQAGDPSWLSRHKPGSPLTVKTDARRIEPGLVLIGLVLEGRAGETYRPVVTKSGVPLDAPGLQIVDKQGNVLEKGQFEYG